MGIYSKITLCLSIFIALASVGFTQTPKKFFNPEDIDSTKYAQLLAEYGKNKILPQGFEKQTLLALSFFPELKEIAIEFRIKKKHSPLLARPKIASAIFNPGKNRKYLIIISNKTLPYMERILLKNLSFNAQVGVLGHELSHISYFVKHSRLVLLKVAFGNLSRPYMDRLEYKTDGIAIDHGLGWQLLSWSLHVNKPYRRIQITDVEASGGGKKRPRERYMYPETITKIIESHPLYK
jgi:hypothetical protein